jgi:predicted RNA-binding protein with PUA-like domain
MRTWLMKTEPDTFSLQDLKSRPGKKEPWNGVRNYQARNFMRDNMTVGDPVFFYHSSCQPPGIVGLAEISSKPKPDPTATDPQSPYFDAKSEGKVNPWVLVDVRFRCEFPEILTLDWLKSQPSLAKLMVLKRGMRLSIQPVSQEDYLELLRLIKNRFGSIKGL